MVKVTCAPTYIAHFNHDHFGLDILASSCQPRPYWVFLPCRTFQPGHVSLGSIDTSNFAMHDIPATMYFTFIVWLCVWFSVDLNQQIKCCSRASLETNASRVENCCHIEWAATIMWMIICQHLFCWSFSLACPFTTAQTCSQQEILVTRNKLVTRNRRMCKITSHQTHEF